MKTVHWSIQNGSGMNNVAQSMVDGEKAKGIDSIFANPERPESWVMAEDADIHVTHTHFPEPMRKRVSKPLKLVYVGHGTPEHVFQSSVEAGQRGGYAAPDSFMLFQHWLRTADAVVTFWPRHQAIWQSMCDKGRKVNLVPMGVDKSLWKPFQSRGKFTGKPSVFSSENPHYCKWSLDLLILWPWIREELTDCQLHLTYMPRDQHRWFFPLVNRNGAGYASFISEIVFKGDDLRNAFCSTDFYCGLVRYGDFNRLSLEANACGAATISYAGNPYSRYWVREGDQREMAKELLAILSGKTEPRVQTPVPDLSEQTEAMMKVYESIL